MTKAPLSVEDALAQILSGAEPVGTEAVPLSEAAGRTLAEPLVATLTQPPFDATAMDGYAVRLADVEKLPAELAVIGEAAAGHPFSGDVAPGQAVRIFTGAPLPKGADAIVIQENTQANGSTVRVVDVSPDPSHIRPSGGDFKSGEAVLAAGIKLEARHIGLAAAMGHPSVVVYRKPLVAILSTGDELVEPGTTPAAGQIVSSNGFALAAMIAAAGGQPHLLGIARDTAESLAEKIDEAKDADILVTIGGASVGDHDLVAPALKTAGFEMDFWKIAMRPGKPLMQAKRPGQRAIGLPGNPVSSIVCTKVFIEPLVKAMCGQSGATSPTRTARLATPLGPNGPRQHYMRATVEPAPDGHGLIAKPAENQDSSLLTILAQSNALLIRAPNQPALEKGDKVTVMQIDF